MRIEDAISTLKKYHDTLLGVYADYAVYSKSENYNDKSTELACRANSVRLAVSDAICALEKQLPSNIVNRHEVAGLELGQCPICKKMVFQTDNYCKECGNALKCPEV